MYEYISTYSAPGYTITRESIEKQLDKEAEDDFNNTVLLLLFLMQMHSLDLGDALQEEMEKQIKIEEAERIEEVKARIRELKGKQKLSGKEMDEYILIQNERIQYLETQELALKSANSVIEKQKGTIQSLKGDIANLYEEKESMARAYEDRIAKRQVEHEKELGQVITENTNLIQTKRDLEGEIANMQHSMDIQREKFDSAITQNNAFRNQLGLEVDYQDYTDEDKFKLIEKEYKLIGDYYKMAWKKTKKRLQREILFKKVKDEKFRQ